MDLEYIHPLSDTTPLATSSPFLLLPIMFEIISSFIFSSFASKSSLPYPARLQLDHQAAHHFSKLTPSPSAAVTPTSASGVMGCPPSLNPCPFNAAFVFGRRLHTHCTWYGTAILALLCLDHIVPLGLLPTFGLYRLPLFHSDNMNGAL